MTMKSTILLIVLLAGGFTTVAHAADIPGFTAGYVVRTGHLNADGRVDIFLQHKAKVVPISVDDISFSVPLPPNVGEFVLQQNPSGEFDLVSNLTAQAKQAVKQWAIQSAIDIIRKDLNVDGIFDVLLSDVGTVIPGAKNVIVFAAPGKNSPPSVVRNVDPGLDKFIKDVGGFSDNPNYFASGVSVQCWIVYLQTLHYDSYTLEYYYSYDPYLVCQYYFDPSAFSVPAINFLNRFVPAANSGGIVAQSSDGISISQQLRNLFGIMFFKGALEYGGYPDNECGSLPYPDSDTCAAPRRLGDLVDILRDLVVGARDSVSCSQGVPHHYSLSPGNWAVPLCTIGEPFLTGPQVCSTQVVYHEQLTHPVLGYTLNHTPVREGQPGFAQLGFFGSLDDAGPIVFHVNKPTLWHQNHTVAGHKFHVGYVNRQTVVHNNKAYITTEGGGTGDCKTFNEIVGVSAFTVDDLLIRDHLRTGWTQLHEPIP